MKRVADLAALEDARRHLDPGYLLKTGVFMLEGFDRGDLDSKTVQFVYERLCLYLRSWVIPKIDSVISDLEK